jgi:TIR domain
MNTSSAVQSNLRDLFLSHRTANKEFDRVLAADVEAEAYQGRGLVTWLDEAEIRPGQSIPAMVNAGLECSRFFGLVMAPDYFDPASTGCTDAEWHAALHGDADNRRARLIPFYFSGGGTLLTGFAAACGYVRNRNNMKMLEGALEKLILLLKQRSEDPRGKMMRRLVYDSFLRFFLGTTTRLEWTDACRSLILT